MFHMTNAAALVRLAQTVAARRDELGLSQRGLATKAGFNFHRMIADIESGKARQRGFEKRTLTAVEKALEMEEGSLLRIQDGGEPEPAAPTGAPAAVPGAPAAVPGAPAAVPGAPAAPKGAPTDAVVPFAAARVLRLARRLQVEIAAVGRRTPTGERLHSILTELTELGVELMGEPSGSDAEVTLRREAPADEDSGAEAPTEREP